LETNESNLLQLLNIFLELGVDYWNICCEDGRASVELSYPSGQKARRLCDLRGVESELVLLGGVPYYFCCLLKRPGIIIGIILSAILLILGTSVLWDVRVEGNESLSDDEVRTLLAEKGIREGAYLSSMDIGTARAEIEAESREIAWLSINVIGTVAYVRVVESKIPEPQPKGEGDGINLVAARDGVITSFEVITGEICTQVGQTVRAGELLVSGLYDSERFGWRAVESRGAVFARFQTQLAVEIPYEYTVKSTEKSEICEISLIFFSFRQKFFKKCGFSGSNCDTINSDIYIYSSNGCRVPIGLSITKQIKSTESLVKRTRKEAVELAYFELNRQLVAKMPEAEILSKSFFAGETEDGSAFKLVCTVDCIDDISQEMPFYVNRSE
jgi:similar to stage IV sporulation protein